MALGSQSLYWLPVRRWQYPWRVGQLIQFQSANLASLPGSLKTIYKNHLNKNQFDFWVCRQMGYLNPLIQGPVFIYSSASYKSDPKRNNGWTAWPFWAIIPSGMGGGKDSVSRVFSSYFYWRKWYTSSAKHIYLSDCFVFDCLSFFSPLSRTHVLSLITSRKQCILHTSQHLFRP